MKRVFLPVLCIVALTISTRSYGQSDLDNLIKGSQADANYLAQGYMAPALNAIGSGLNQGWYNTAAVHKVLGFDLTLSGSLIYYPSSDQSYQVDNNKLTTLKLVSPSSGGVPTIFGGSQAPTYDYKSGPSAPFQGPAGVSAFSDLGAFPLPILNLGVGLPLNTDLKLRLLPGYKAGDATLNVFGIGLMHDVKQYIPGLKEVPLDLSAFVGYTSFTAEVPFDPKNNPSQIGKTEFSATTIQGVISKKIAVLTVYGSLGYNFASGSFKATGSYPDPNTGIIMKDPVSLTSSTSGPRFGGGLRLKFAFFTLHGDYTFQTYNTLTVGFGVAVR